MTDISDILYVARNLRADPETQALGEDAPVLNVIADQVRALMLSIESARYLVHSKDAKDMLAEFDLSLFDAWHDCSGRGVCERAKEAYEEAKVVPIKRPSAPKLTVVPK